MPEGILASVIGVAGSALGSMVGIFTSQKLVAYRLEQLEKRVQAHNNLIERMYRVEDKLNQHEEKLSAAEHRVRELEKRRQA